MDKKIFTALFSSRTDAVVAVEDGVIVFLNSAAEKLFNRICEGRKAEDFFSPLLLDGEDVLTGAVQVGDKSIPAVSSKFEGVRIITLMSEPGQDEIFMDTLGSVSSAVRESLAIMQMTTGLVEQRTGVPTDEKLITYAAVIQHAYSNLQRVTEHIAELCVQGSEKLRISCIDMVELCRDAVDSASYLACINGPEMTFKCDEKVIFFNGDSGRIEQMLLNLISNSLKFTPSDGKITVTLKKTENGVIITVADTGCGIDRSEMAGLFSIHRDMREVKNPKTGIGMGLPLVQHIANLHMGSAVLESEEGKGTKVTVYLKNTESEIILRTPEEEYKAGGLSRVLMELTDVVDYKAFLPKNMD